MSTAKHKNLESLAPKSSQPEIPNIDEVPPSFNYEINFASQLEKQWIISQLKSINRQTMNFRASPTAQALILKDRDKDNKIIGWQGFDIGRRDLPEKFSLHLDSDYRKFLLGLTLEYSLAVHLQQEGIDVAYIRMDSAGNGQLKEWRLQQGLFSLTDMSKADPKWLGMCAQCELYKVSCHEQAFLSFHVDKMVEFGNKRLQLDQTRTVPAMISLAPHLIRTSSESRVEYLSKWVA